MEWRVVFLAVRGGEVSCVGGGGVRGENGGSSARVGFCDEGGGVIADTGGGGELYLLR